MLDGEERGGREVERNVVEERGGEITRVDIWEERREEELAGERGGLEENGE